MRASILTLAAVVVAFIGCGSNDASPGSSTGGAAGNGAAGSGGAAGAASGVATCSGGTLVAGTATVPISYGGADREYLIHVPASYDGTKPYPLVLNIHGYQSDMNQEQVFTQMDKKADSAGFIVVYPQGLRNPGTTDRSWNAGTCCAIGDENRDDVGYIGAVIDDVEKNGCVDAKRVYSTGMSNGAFMTNYLGCKLADRIAAIAPVAGTLVLAATDQCQPSRPVPVIAFNGTGDPDVPYNGGATPVIPGMVFPSVPDVFAGWASRDGCTGTPKTTFTNGAAHCSTYDTCSAGASVTLCTIDGMGHCWPGTAVCPAALGTASTDVVADDAMWDLFKQVGLP